MTTRSDTKQEANRAGVRATKVPRVTCAQCQRSLDVSWAEPFSVVECPDCGKPLVVPLELKQFHLCGVLGQGSMGFVYRAIDRTLRRNVAVKVLRAIGDDRLQQATSCLEEARALASLNHPNVVQIYSVDQSDDDQPFIVMEMVNGGRLDKMIQQEGYLDEARALQVGIDVAKGLQAAYTVGLIHGDVKPANILLNRAGVAKLVDFGIARAADEDGLAQARGTPRYVAPEVILKRPADHRADQFSLGATLFHALSGRYPFDGPSVAEVLRARLETPAEDLRRIRTSLHAETASVVRGMLEIDPAERFADYQEVQIALQEAREAALSGPAQPNLFELDHARQDARPIRRRRRVKAKKNRWPIIALSMAALVLSGWIGSTLWWNARQRSKLQLSERPGDPTRWVALLNLVDLRRDAVAGRWAKRQAGLVVADSEAGRLNIPFTIEGSYETQIELSFSDDRRDACVFLPVGRRQVMFVMGEQVGLQWIDGEPIEENGTARDLTKFPAEYRYKLHMTVTIESDGATIKINQKDETLVDWSGAPSSLSVREPWTGIKPQVLGLGGQQSQVVFHEVRVRSLSRLSSDEKAPDQVSTDP